MPKRRLPVRPDLDQLRHQARDLLRAVRVEEPEALTEFQQFHPRAPSPAEAKLADAQLVLARAYEAPSWPRLVQACQLAEAIWGDDLDTVRALVTRNPALLQEPTLIRKSDWGPPMSYAANVGRDRIIRMLHDLGARDHAHALDRAVLQGQIGTARMLHDMQGRPVPPDELLGGAAYTLSASGTALLFDLGARVVDATGRSVAPTDTVLETDSRKPAEKHAILAMYVRHGLVLPDTAPMAIHRGRIDLLEQLEGRDASCMHRTYRFEEIFPPELGCHDEVLATHGTPLAGATLLHMAVDYDEWEIANWLLERGCAVDGRADVDADGFGGHTALFSTVVSQPAFWMNMHRTGDARFTNLLLRHGADIHARASLRKQLHPGYYPDTLHEYREVSPVEWGRQFHDQRFVNKAAIAAIELAGGEG